MNTFENVDELIRSAPPEFQKKLTTLRQLIKQTAPLAQEQISYGMAFYAYKGRLIYFGLQKKHIGLYIPPPIIEQHQKELTSFGTTKSAIHLPLTGELPVALIKKLIQARLKWNEEHDEKKNTN